MPITPYAQMLRGVSPQRVPAAVLPVRPAAGRPGPTYYTDHLALIRPYATVISVGRDNCYGHPSPQALRLYENHTIGVPISGRPNERIKLVRTDIVGTIWINLPDSAFAAWQWHG